jgi:hypothetical protein
MTEKPIKEVSFLTTNQTISLKERKSSPCGGNEAKLVCSDCSCEAIFQPCEACPNYFAQKSSIQK